MITAEQKEEVVKLYRKSVPKAQIALRTHVSRPKVLAIIKEAEKNAALRRVNGSTTVIVANSTKGLNRELKDYDKALQRIKDAANDDLLGPSVRKAIAKNGFILKESPHGIREQISSFLDGMNTQDAIKILEMLMEMNDVMGIRKNGPKDFVRYMTFAKYVVTNGYSIEDTNFLIQNGKYLEMFRDYQKSIDKIAEMYGVPEHEALAYAFIGIDDYFRRRAELEKEIREKEEQMKIIDQELKELQSQLSKKSPYRLGIIRTV